MKRFILATALCLIIAGSAAAQSVTLAPAAPSWINSIGASLSFPQTYTFSLDGQNGIGQSVFFKITRLKAWDMVELDAGAYWTFAQDLGGDGHLRNYAGLGICTAFPDAKRIDAWFHGLPVIGAAPVDLSTAQVFVGIGDQVDSGNFQKTLALSVGISFKWGK